MSELSEFQDYIAGLTKEQKAELDTVLIKELKSAWLPHPENKPQIAACCSKADLLLFGGQAGGGKTDLICGLALTEHSRSIIYRRQSSDLKGFWDRLLELCPNPAKQNSNLKTLVTQDGRSIDTGHLEMPGSEKSAQGIPRDFIAFDEGAQLSRAKVQFVLGWLRSTNPKQRCRAVIASNPPTGGEGEWLIEWFSPWLDDRFPNPAKDGELRWAVTASDREGTTVWLKDGSPIVFTEGKNYRLATQKEIKDKHRDVIMPMTRTFIRSRLDDNPFLKNTNYRAQLQALPEPLRSQMLHGDFTAGRQDHEWQIIPTIWVKEAMARWTPNIPDNAMMSALAADIAQGGADNTVLSPRHGPWYAPLIVVPGIETPKPSDAAALIVRHRRNGAAIVVDVGGGYGGGVKERLEENDIHVRPFNGANSSNERTEDKQLTFVNKRAEAHWRFREALDPDQLGGSKIALPPDPQLQADLTAVRWKLSGSGIQVESKEDIKKPDRLGRSPDRGDAVIMAWSEGEKAIVSAMKKRIKPIDAIPKMPDYSINPQRRGVDWLRKYS